MLAHCYCFCLLCEHSAVIPKSFALPNNWPGIIRSCSWIFAILSKKQAQKRHTTFLPFLHNPCEGLLNLYTNTHTHTHTHTLQNKTQVCYGPSLSSESLLHICQTWKIIKTKHQLLGHFTELSGGRESLFLFLGTFLLLSHSQKSHQVSLMDSYTH